MKSAKRRSKRDQTHRRMRRERYDAHKHLSQCCVTDYYINVREKLSYEGVLSTHPVGYSGSLSTVNETNCNKKERPEQNKKSELTSNSFRCVPPRGTCR